MLELLLALPLVGALVVMLLPDRQDVSRYGAFVFALLSLVVAILVYTGGAGLAGMHNVVNVPWIPSIGVRWHLGVDAIAVFMIILTTLLATVTILYGGITQKPRAYYALMLIMEALTLGAFLAQDLVLFYIFWEAMLIPAYLLVAGWAGPRGPKVALNFLLFSLVPSLFMLVAIVVMGYEGYLATGHWTFDMATLQSVVRLPGGVQSWLFGAFAVAFAVKIPVFPLHSWMPDTYVESPAPVTAFLSGAMAKTGLYAFLRIAIPLLPAAAHVFAPWLAAAGLIGLLYAALVALVGTDAKRIVAFSSMSHLGLVLVGIAALNPIAVQGVVLQMFNHGIYGAALFLLVGVLEARLGTRDLSKLGGLEGRAPVFSAVFFIMVLTALGLPGLSGFSGEFLILTGVYKSHPVWAWIAVAAVILAAAYFIRLYQRTVHFGEPQKRDVQMDIRFSELLPILPLLLLVFWLGFHPGALGSSVAHAVPHVLTSQVSALSEVAGK